MMWKPRGTNLSSMNNKNYHEIDEHIVFKGQKWILTG